jgi:hypothetical protein
VGDKGGGREGDATFDKFVVIFYGDEVVVVKVFREEVSEEAVFRVDF